MEEMCNLPGAIYPIVPEAPTKPSGLLLRLEERNFADPKSPMREVMS